MCLICDADMLGELFKPGNDAMEPVKNWLVKGGRLVYTTTDKFKEEFKANSHNMRELQGLARRDILNKANKREVSKEEKSLREKYRLKSNDYHVIALARVTETKLLISGDKKLHKDFKNRKLVGSSIYQNQTHEHLLNHDCCP